MRFFDWDSDPAVLLDELDPEVVLTAGLSGDVRDGASPTGLREDMRKREVSRAEFARMFADRAVSILSEASDRMSGGDKRSASA